MDAQAEKAAQARLAEQIRQENEEWRRTTRQVKASETEGMTPQEILLWELGLSRDEIVKARR